MVPDSGHSVKVRGRRFHGVQLGGRQIAPIFLISINTSLIRIPGAYEIYVLKLDPPRGAIYEQDIASGWMFSTGA
jgi:hypothetical protein